MADVDQLESDSDRPASNWVGDLIAALANLLSISGSAISMATLVFVGGLASELPRAIAAFTVAGAVLAVVQASRSQFVPMAVIVQDGPSVVLAVVAATFAARSASTATDVFVLIALTTLVAGAAMWLLGRLGLGMLVRYVPTTVVGAFIAGTGWILVKGGLDVMVGRSVSLSEVSGLFDGDTWGHWVPGILLALAIWLVGRSDRLPPVVMSVVIVSSVAVFYVVVQAFSSVQTVESDGWLVGPFPTQSGVQFVTPSEISGADWAGVLAALPGMITVVLVAILSLLLNITGVESMSQRRVDVDAELRLAGWSNIVVSPLGSAVGYLGLADTVLLKSLAVRGRVVPILSAVALGVVGVVGIGAIGYVPRLVVGALLVTIGIELLYEWIVGLVRMVSKVEQLMSIAIVLLIASVGILEGIAAGFVAACVVFIVRYSRIDPVRRSSSGQGMRSRVDRSAVEVAALTARSEQLAVFELHGYLFFGSLTDLDGRVQSVLSRDDGRSSDALILDFQSVSGIDASGYTVIGEVVAAAVDRDVQVVISALDSDIRDALQASEPQRVDSVIWADTLDRALEHTERLQLERSGASEVEPDGEPFSEALSQQFRSVTFSAGEVLMRQGDPSDGMLVVRGGQLTAFRVDDGGVRYRLRRFGEGAMIGEIGLVTGATRSAEIVADTDIEALELSGAEYTRLRRELPHLAFELHEYIMRGQAARVVSLSEGVARLSR